MNPVRGTENGFPEYVHGGSEKAEPREPDLPALTFSASGRGRVLLSAPPGRDRVLLSGKVWLSAPGLVRVLFSCPGLSSIEWLQSKTKIGKPSKRCGEMIIFMKTLSSIKLQPPCRRFPAVWTVPPGTFPLLLQVF